MIVEVGGPDDPPLPHVVDRAAAVLRTGHVVVLPTDTVYGLAVAPQAGGTAAALFALKGRAPHVPVAVLCASADQALGLAAPGSVSDEVRRIATRLWPGPLTLVLARRPGLDWDLGEPASTIGVRCPEHALVRALAAEVGPLATTSANRHREPTPAAAGDVAALFGAGVGLVLDGGPCEAPPSAVVDATGLKRRLLRSGRIGLADIDAASRP